MSRRKIQQEIARVNHQMGQVLDRQELPRSRQYRLFPVWSWAAAGALWAWTAYGDQTGYAEAHAMSKGISYVGAWLVGLLAALRTLLWIVRPRPNMASVFHERNTQMRTLEQQRRTLMNELKDTGEE